MLEAHSISAGLDYPGVGPEHSWLKDSAASSILRSPMRRRWKRFSCCQLEGIIPALESAHAVAHAVRVAPTMKKDEIIAVSLSGRGDKDIFSVAEELGKKL